MKTYSILVAALIAFSAMSIAPAQRMAQVRFGSGQSIEAQIVEPDGVMVYAVFQGSGIQGTIETMPTLASGCPTSLCITIGPLATHNHKHTIDWTDCGSNNGTIHHRWELPVPLNTRWLSGTPLSVRTCYGFGCGMQSPLGLDIDAPPTLGSNPSFTVDSVPASTTLVAVQLTFNETTSFYPLTALGLPSPECFVFIDLASAMLAGLSTSSSSTQAFPLAIPAAPLLSGLIARTQAAALSPGQNPAGIVTSNGLSLIFGQ